MVKFLIRMKKVNKIINEFYSSDNKTDNHLQEMSNLDTDDTGISKGYIWVSTKYPVHNSRIKYFPEKTGDGQPNIRISISDNPKIVAGNKQIINKIPQKHLNQVFKWVSLNHEKLQYFWDEGTKLTRREVNAFFDSLQKI